MVEDVPFSTIRTAVACTAKFCHAVIEICRGILRKLPCNSAVLMFA